jgi:hypothetical protein
MKEEKIITDLERIKVLFHIGKVSYDDAKEMAKEPLKRLNDKAIEVARRYGKKVGPITFSEYMR